MLHVYGAAGGVPAYLKLFNSKLSFWENVEQLYLTKGGVLYEEAEYLLRQELREPRAYMMIMKSISEGKRRVTDIASDTGLDKSAVSRYLHTLELLDLVGFETPALEKPKTKKRLYYIKDCYMRFWFRYIYPNRDLIEEWRSAELLEEIKRDYSSYMSWVFERIARKLLAKVRLPAKPVKLSRQWGKTSKGAYEIDILGYTLDKRVLLAFEVKWASLKLSDARRILSKLAEKLKAARLEPERAYYGIVAREVDGKSLLREEGYLVFDLKDVEKALTQ